MNSTLFSDQNNLFCLIHFNLIFEFMKKRTFLILGASLFVFISFSCEKEVPNKANQNFNPTLKSLSTNNYAEENRSYVWVEGNTKLDCSAAGNGCVVKSSYNTDIDITVNQVLTLMDAGRNNLNTYFLNNDFSYDFPGFYVSTVYDEISTNQLNLYFEFPYLFVKKNGETIKIYNYESTLNNTDVLNRLSSNGYTKKISVNTSEGGAWKCTEAGDNCKVQPFKININWLANNPKFAFIPNQNSSNISGYELDQINRKIIFTKNSSEKFGIEL